jgi:hypothetical protein
MSYEEEVDRVLLQSFCARHVCMIRMYVCTYVRPMYVCTYVCVCVCLCVCVCVCDIHIHPSPAARESIDDARREGCLNPKT